MSNITTRTEITTTTTSTTTTTANPTTVVLVDPTSPDGETALGAIDPSESEVAVVMLLSGRHSSALRDFARAEDLDLATAGWIYLEQVHERIARPGLTVECVLTTGPSVDADVAVLARDRTVGRVILPSSMAAADRQLADRIRRTSAVDVTVADLATTR